MGSSMFPFDLSLEGIILERRGKGTGRYGGFFRSFFPVCCFLLVWSGKCGGGLVRSGVEWSGKGEGDTEQCFYVCMCVGVYMCRNIAFLSFCSSTSVLPQFSDVWYLSPFGLGIAYYGTFA